MGFWPPGLEGVIGEVVAGPAMTTAVRRLRQPQRVGAPPVGHWKRVVGLCSRQRRRLEKKNRTLGLEADASTE